MSDTTEQQARDLLDRIGVPYAQEYSAGDLVVLANFIADKEKCERELAAASAAEQTATDAYVAEQALTQQLQRELEQNARDILRLIETIKYLRGIAVRGEGRDARDDETIEQFVLGYVKRIEAELEQARRDAQKLEWCVRNSRWLRHEHEAYVAIPVAVDADLGCVAARRAAIDAAWEQGK